MHRKKPFLFVKTVKMISQLSHVMTLANSIIGVSVLAMPFCFKQCGIVLATLVLLLSSVLSRLACHFLIKSAVMSRRRNFELLAFHAFGHMGKFLVELFIIGFLVGTCIAFFVVMGDLGPQIVGKVIDKNPEDIRTSLLITTSVFIVLPLGLLRNIDSLSSLCTATVTFYLCLVLKIMAESMQHIFAGDWYEHVHYWRPSGILQCVPIFSMALFCQTQLFEIYETIPNVSLEKMNGVVRGALNICTVVYLCVGLFGYIAFCTQSFTGNILMSLESSLSSEMIKMGFVFSIAFSFPLVIFPCRASLNSLLFRRVYTHEPSINYLPETRFRCLTIAIVAVSLITGILIPNIEFVLGLVGSTIGVMICLIFPAIFFISISSKHTNERLLAQVILFIGICIMILCTYANLYALEESTNTKALATTSKPLLNQINNLPLNLKKEDINEIANIHKNPELFPDIKEKVNQQEDLNVLEKSLNVKANDVRQEPPIPVERVVVTEKPAVETQKSVENIVVTFAPVIEQVVEKINSFDGSLKKESNIKIRDDIAKTVESATAKAEAKVNRAVIKESFTDVQRNDNLINSDAIKKEESELAAEAEAVNMMVAERHEKLRKTLEKHKQEQLQMMQEQKEILKDLKEQKQEIERQKQRIIKDALELKENEKRLKTLDRESVPRLNLNFSNLNKNGEKESLNEITTNHDEKAFDKKAEGMRLEDQPEETNKSGNLKGQVSEGDKELNAPSKHENANKSRSNQIHAHGNSFSVEDANNEAVDDEKVEATENAKLNVSKDLPKGPILNALTKRVSQKSISANELVSNNENDDIVQKSNLQEKSDSKAENEKAQREYALPIALKMRSQTKVGDAVVLLANKSEENIQVLRRDILENHEREKREIDEKVTETNTKVTGDISRDDIEYLLNNSSIIDDREKCSKLNENTNEKLIETSKQKMNDDPSGNDLLESSLIKTNVYLSEQEIANAISVGPNIALSGEYVKLKQRDLKSVDTGEDCNI